MLTQSLARRREFTVRAALGAGRWRLLRQLLTESLMLSCAGGVLGLGFAFAGVWLVRRFGPSTIPDWTEPRRICACLLLSLLALC